MNAQVPSEQWYAISEFERRPNPVTVERYTDDSVWIRGKRCARLKTWEGIFPTVEEAWDWVICKAVGRRDVAQRQLDTEQKRLDTIRAEKDAWLSK